MTDSACSGDIELEAPSSPAQQLQLDHEISGTEITRSDSQMSSSSSEAAGAYSKEAMVKLMREQVDLVRYLTNAQIAQKKELEDIKAEKRRLEEEREKEKLMREQVDLVRAQIVQQKELEEFKAEKRRLEEEREKERQCAAESAAKKNFNSNNADDGNNGGSGGGGGRSKRLNLPIRSITDREDSDNQTMSTFSRYFNRTPSIKSQRTTKYRHPDEEYYRRDRDSRTRAFSDEEYGTVTSTFGMQQYSRPYRYEPPSSKDRITITPIPERNVIPKEELNKNGCVSILWWLFSYFCTLFVPNFFLCCIGRKIKSKHEKKEAKQAWREKVAIFVIMMLFSAAFIGVSGVVPLFLCRETKSQEQEILCKALNITMYAVMIAIAAVLGIQCICSLIYVVRMKHTITRGDTQSKVIIMVPCYNEGDKELRKTIDSVMDTTYPDDNKVLLVVADGNITGKGENMSTPDTLSRILGFKQNKADRAYDCKSIGELTENRAKLYYGTKKDCGRELKYMVIVKCGIPSESGSPRAGNRGKRDSQLLFTGLLNRFHHGRKLNNLDLAIKYALDHLQIPLDEIRYLMAIDADTRVDRESLSHMTYSMGKDDRILALCGETKVDNKAQSWVTMIQVFEYYTNHHMKKAFESVFGCVTCLPGCFTMYRLFSDDCRPLLSCDDVYQRYANNNVKTLHEKNLFHLGEDRFLTTLLLRYFPDMKLSFVPEATCYTIVPDKFSVLLSQRRRWINSTFHNMLELMRVNTLCGFCCFSMKSIVVLDLVATLILPASLIYVGYILVITFWMGEQMSMIMLVVWGIVIGVQVVVFVLRYRWDYWWWFIVFILAGVPVFYFILPLYSFWHMDDFSWGTTRQVSGGNGNVKSAPSVDKSPSGDTDGESSRGFEVVGSRIINASDYDSKAKSSGGGQKSKQQQPSVPSMTHGVKSGYHQREQFDKSKYKNAEEARQARRERRREC